MVSNKPPTFPLARSGAGHAPLRRPGSVRRTTSIESRWPDASGGNVVMIGRARDVATSVEGAAPIVLETGAFRIEASPRREILTITTEPDHPRSQELVGVRAGGASREALMQAMGGMVGAPIYQLLDDYAGASLISGWILPHWNRGQAREVRDGEGPPRKGPAINICTGFAEGSSALDALRRPANAAPTRTEVAPLEHPADPDGWHEMCGAAGPYTCRARRVDVWADGDSVVVDAGFQDSGQTPDGARIALHEYRVHAIVDRGTMVLRSLKVLPLILPFAECPGAALKASRMVGQPLGEFRQRVINTLPYADGCTHLNDVLRSLADVPKLVAKLTA